jgi:hypothetical protein
MHTYCVNLNILIFLTQKNNLFIFFITYWYYSSQKFYMYLILHNVKLHFSQFFNYNLLKNLINIILFKILYILFIYYILIAYSKFYLSYGQYFDTYNHVLMHDL